MNDLQKKISELGVVPVIKLSTPSGMPSLWLTLCAQAVCLLPRSLSVLPVLPMP